jgi:hypothetical protein
LVLATHAFFGQQYLLEICRSMRITTVDDNTINYKIQPSVTYFQETLSIGITIVFAGQYL